jgi:hypothetical protein
MSNAVLNGLSFTDVSGQVQPFITSVDNTISLAGIGFNTVLNPIVLKSIPTDATLKGLDFNTVLSPIVLKSIPTEGSLKGLALTDVTDSTISMFTDSIANDASLGGMSFSHIAAPWNINQTGNLSGSPLKFIGFTFNEAVSGKPPYIPPKLEGIDPNYDIQFDDQYALCWRHRSETDLYTDNIIDWIVRFDNDLGIYEFLNKQMEFEEWTGVSQFPVPPSGVAYNYPPSAAMLFSEKGFQDVETLASRTIHTTILSGGSGEYLDYESVGTINLSALGNEAPVRLME